MLNEQNSIVQLNNLAKQSFFYNISLIHCTPKGSDGDFRRKLYTNGFSLTDNILHSV